jgi:hypothetical protein
VNGRIGGHVNELAKSACGVDLPRLAALQALGEPVEVGEMCPATVHFQHHGLAPTRPCELMSIDGDQAVRRLPGICGYRPFVRMGEHLPGGVMTQPIDLLWGECDDHDAMSAAIRSALSVLSYESASTTARAVYLPLPC